MEETKPRGTGTLPSPEYDWLIIRGRVIRLGRVEVLAFLAVVTGLGLAAVLALWAGVANLGRIADILEVK